MNGGNAAQFSPQAPSQFAAPTPAQPSSPQFAAPAAPSAFQQPEMPPEMEAPPPFDGDEQFASSEPPEDVPYDPNEEPYVPDDEPYVPDDDFGAMDDFG